MENYEFDAVKERDRLVEALRELALQQGFSRVVLGISGGKDSSVSAALCARTRFCQAGQFSSSSSLVPHPATWPSSST